ncbi:hypothetical protein ACWCQL_38260 [Streptomyces sp. NPDC002073]
MNLEAETNAERADDGAVLVSLFTERAAVAGELLTRGDRAEIGRTMAEAFFAEVDIPEGYDCEALSLMIVYLFHHADGLISPAGLMHVAGSELRSTVNTVPLLNSIGEDGQPGLIAGAITAVIAHAEATGDICADHLTDMAYTGWSADVEEERFIQVKAARAARTAR